jgi:hypothetical protein
MRWSIALIDVEPLKLTLLRRDGGPAAYLGPHLDARISNPGWDEVTVRRAALVGADTDTRVPVATRLKTIDAGESVDRQITLPWSAARRLRDDRALALELESDDGERVRSDHVDTDGIQTWTPGEEVKAAAGVLGTGVVWWIMWRTLVEAPGWLQLVLGAVGTFLMARVCWEFYAPLWRGDPVWGTGVAIGPTRRVRPFTDVVLSSVGVWLALTPPFAFATFMIDADQLGADAATQFANALGLYVWNALNVVPFVDATDTLNWTEPVRDYSTATGVLLLVYKGLVLAPLIAAARAAWRGRGTA